MVIMMGSWMPFPSEPSIQLIAWTHVNAICFRLVTDASWRTWPKEMPQKKNVLEGISNLTLECLSLSY